MLLLTKSTLAIMIGFILAIIIGLIAIPFLKRLKFGQTINQYLRKTHSEKKGTPTMGGIIFILPTLLAILILYVLDKISISYNLVLVLVVFFSYGLLGFIDDFLIIKRKKNEGLTALQKFIGQALIALIFFWIFMQGGNDPILWIHTFNIKIHLGVLYGFFILFYIIGFSNAVNLTDGLDGLAGGLSTMSFLTLGILSLNATWLAGYEEIGIFCFVLVGALFGFLIFNTKPAKVFMGDTGSLALGGVMATVAILTRHEIVLLAIGGVFIIETLSVIIQVTSFKLTGKRVFLMSPLHHHFEKLGWIEQDIVKLFWIVGLLFNMAAITFAAWI
ncbi:MAG: phospho-N-acetylmuramoyl-pentapeptide-transferase [Bacilli bacterium]